MRKFKSLVRTDDTPMYLGYLISKFYFNEFNSNKKGVADMSRSTMVGVHMYFREASKNWCKNILNLNLNRCN